MIKIEFEEYENKKFKKTYSDEFFIQKIGTNEIYAEAYDLQECEFEYEETDILLD